MGGGQKTGRLLIYLHRMVQTLPDDLKAALEKAFQAEYPPVFQSILPWLIGGLIFLCILPRILLPVFKKTRGRLLVFLILYISIWVFYFNSLGEKMKLRGQVISEIPAKTTRALELVQRMLSDATSAAVRTETGTYLALGGEQMFLPKKVTEVLENSLRAKNLQLP
jgi:hypothetical protein